MENYQLPEREVKILEYIRKNHPNYSVRQRASIILFHTNSKNLKNLLIPILHLNLYLEGTMNLVFYAY